MIGSCLDLASPTRGTILAALTAACLQTHLASRQEKGVIIIIIIIIIIVIICLCEQVITGSSDSTVRVWDGKTCDCIASFRPPQALSGGERAVLDVHLYPHNVDHIIVCTRSSTVFVMTLQGQVIILFHRFLNSHDSFSFPAWRICTICILWGSMVTPEPLANIWLNCLAVSCPPCTRVLFRLPTLCQNSAQHA